MPHNPTCFVGYQVALEEFIWAYKISIGEAIQRAHDLFPVPKNKFTQDDPSYWIEKYFQHLINQSGSKIVMQSTDKGLTILGIPLDDDITVCPFNGAVPLSRLLETVQAARDIFFEELAKIGGGEIDLSAVKLWGVEDPYTPENRPEPRLYEWNG